METKHYKPGKIESILEDRLADLLDHCTIDREQFVPLVMADIRQDLGYNPSAAPKLLEACKNFFEWHANHFEDFDNEINGQLLCLANDCEAAINDAEKGAS